jgi:hypothetical protein
MFLLGNKGAKKDIMDAKNINVLVHENEIPYSTINESENNFIHNLYDHGLPMSSI